MNEFPEFMRHPTNRIVTTDQAPGVEGYVFDGGANEAQMAFWTCRQTAASAAHVHDHDECMIVVEGRYTLIINGQRILLKAGDEYFIATGTPHSGEVLAGTRTNTLFWRSPR